MSLGPKLLHALAPGTIGPVSRRAGIGRLRVSLEGDSFEFLQQPDQKERHFIISKLLPEAYSRSCIERQENARDWCEVLVNTVVEGPIRIELLG